MKGFPVRLPALALALVLPVTASAAQSCNSDVVRRTALEAAGRELDEGIPASNVATTRTLHSPPALSCEVTVTWADKDPVRYRVTIQRMP